MIAEAPLLQQGLQFYLNAFFALSSCRPVGMAEGRIPWTAVNSYSLRYGLNDVEMDILWVLICELDGEYLDFQSRKNKRATKEPTATPNRNPPPRRR